MKVCKICNNHKDNRSFVAHEMMFGFGDEFDYFECNNCGCLQIEKIPDDIFKYYPSNYYSFIKGPVLKEPLWKRILIHQRAKYYLNGRNILGFLLAKKHTKPVYYEWFKKVGIKFESRILDVGCGSGGYLLNLRRDGFSNLLGIDSFIDNDIFYDNGVKILKKDMSEINDQFDLIMLHHSFEHMPKPLDVFKKLFRLLKPNRYVLLRIPVASSYAWKKYGVNWVQLDPPRHFFLHTIKSIEILADKAGFLIDDVVFDSTEFQFWGSEQYLKGIPFRDKKSYYENPDSSVFTPTDIKAFRDKAMELNAKNDGDQASFYLYKNS